MSSSSSDDESNLHAILRVAKLNKQRDKSRKSKEMNSTKLEILRTLQELKLNNQSAQKKPIRTSRAPNEFKCRTCKEVISSPEIENYQSTSGTRMVRGTCPTCTKPVRKQAGLKGLTADEKKEYYQQKLSSLN